MEEPQLLTKCSSGSIDSNCSPEFEFWIVRNPSLPQPELHSADELFSDGILLPLHLLQCPFNDHPPDPNPPSHKTEPESYGLDRPDSVPGSEISAGESTSSKRWKDIFKRTDKKNSQNSKDEKNLREKKKKCGAVGGSNRVNVAELNVNIWPFSRSRSAGNGGIRRRVVTRKVNSAPCSRSNSAGESKSRKWPSSPSHSGVYLGRSIPVFQVRRSGDSGGGGGSEGQRKVKTEMVVEKIQSEDHREVTSAAVTGGSKTRVLKLNVPICLGYRQHSVCRSDENSGVGVATADGGGQTLTGEGVGSSNLFNIRSIFTKKVH